MPSFDSQPELSGPTLRLRPLTREDFRALVGPENRRSQRALEKIGARRAGTRRNGAGEENVLYALDRPPSSG